MITMDHTTIAIIIATTNATIATIGIGCVTCTTYCFDREA